MNPIPPAPPELRGYRLQGVYGAMPPGLRQAVLRLWIDTGAVPSAEALRRVAEVVVVAHDPEGALVGVNTAYVAVPPGVGGAYYFYRTFIRPAHRGVYGLPTAMLRLAVEVLRGATHPQQPAGVVIVAENPKLLGAAVARRLGRLGFHRLGEDGRGCAVWCLRFDGVVPAVPEGVLRRGQGSVSGES